MNEVQQHETKTGKEKYEETADLTASERANEFERFVNSHAHLSANLPIYQARRTDFSIRGGTNPISRIVTESYC
jgi:hypothetical protein